MNADDTLNMAEGSVESSKTQKPRPKMLLKAVGIYVINVWGTQSTPPRARSHICISSILRSWAPSPNAPFEYEIPPHTP